MHSIMKNSTTTLATLGAVQIVDQIPELEDIASIPAFTESLPEPIKVQLIEGMASHFLTQDEICATVRMSRGEFEGNLVFQAAYQRGHAMGRGSLRRMQFMRAKRDTVMQIWMGKQHLDQHDKVERVKGDDQSDAYEGFLNKLTIKLELSGQGRPNPRVIGEGTGDSPVHLGVVGSEQSAGANSGRVAGQGHNEEIDSGVAGQPDERGQDIPRQLENVVVSRRPRKRKNTERSRVGTSAI